MSSESLPALDLLSIGETMALLTPTGGGLLQLGGTLDLAAGGAESNVAICATRHGLRSAWLSRIGSDPFGQVVQESVARAGVDVSLVRVDSSRRTGMMVKQPGPSGSAVTYYRSHSAASALSIADLENLPTAGVTHTTGITAAISESAREMVYRLLGGARSTGIVSFDVNYRAALWESASTAASVLLELAGLADVVFVGRDEAESLWGTVLAEDIRDLLPKVPTVIVKDADVEAVEFNVAGIVRAPTPAVTVVEPVGAGDAFAAGWLAARNFGWEAEERLSAGHASAAAVLASYSDQAAPPVLFPPLQEVSDDR